MVLVLAKDLLNIPMEEREVLWRQAQNLKGKFSSNEIGKILGLKPRTVRTWIYEGRNPLTTFNRANLDASPELAYIIEVIIGDGNLYLSNGKNYSIILFVKDLDFAEEFNRNIYKVLGMQRSYSINKHEGKFRVWASSKELYTFLREKRNFNSIINAYPADFIRGFADSEECVYHYYLKRRGRKYFTCGIEMSNSNRSYLELVKELLHRHFGIISFIHIEHRKGKVVFNNSLGRIITAKKNCYGLHVCRQTEILKYAQHIGFSIKRKQKVLEEIVNFINARGGSRQRGWNQYALA